MRLSTQQTAGVVDHGIEPAARGHDLFHRLEDRSVSSQTLASRTARATEFLRRRRREAKAATAGARTLSMDMYKIMHGAGVLVRQVAVFAWLQARCCAFAVALLGGMAASTLLPPLPVARYDLLLAYGVLLTGLCYVLGWETRRR